MDRAHWPGTIDDIDLSDVEEFWTRPLEQRHGAFDLLRQQRPFAFFDEVPFGPFPQGPGYHALTRFDHVVEASSNPTVFCSGEGSNITDLPEEFNEFFGSMINMDDPRHGRLRRIVAKGFTPKMLQSLEAGVRTTATRIVDDIIERGEIDFVTDVAAALPLQIICEMMGIPDSQYRFVFDRTNVILGAGDPEYVGAEDPENFIGALLTAGGELAALMKELAEARQADPTDDLTSMLVHGEVDGERLSFDELASFFVLLTVAGNETTRNAISWGLHELTERPDQRRAWQADFEALAPSAVDEIVRYASPVIHFRRTVTTDTVLGGHELSAGDKVVLFYQAANRDPAVFDDPHTFDVTRRSDRHVGFGGPGPHFCLGAHLARREITVMYRELFGRLPDIVATSPPDRLRSNFINGIKHLRAEFTPGGVAAGATAP